MKRLMILVMVAGVMAAFGHAQESTSYGPQGLDELEKTKGVFKTTLLRPDADLSQYATVYARRVLLQFRGPSAEDATVAGSMIKKRSRGAPIPEGEDLDTFRQIIEEAFVGELGSCELFDLAEQIGPDTLLVRVTVMDLVTDIVSKSEKGGDNPKPYSAQGEIVFDLIDAETGVIQARFAERRKSRKAGGDLPVPEEGAEWADISAWAEKAMADFRRELERISASENASA